MLGGEAPVLVEGEELGALEADRAGRDPLPQEGVGLAGSLAARQGQACAGFEGLGDRPGEFEAHGLGGSKFQDSHGAIVL
ncbi:hypothetical protein D3C72_2239220 [compost metagenome]